MSWPRGPLLRSDRFLLEPLSVDHADEMLAALAPRELYGFTGGEPPTLEQLRARYRRQSRGHSEDGSAGWLNWIIRPVQGGTAIGFVQATLVGADPDRVADLAWLVTTSEQGRGVAAEAASTVAAWLASIGVGRLTASIHPAHAASARVAQRIGLAPTTASVDGETVWEGPARPVR